MKIQNHDELNEKVKQTLINVCLIICRLTGVIIVTFFVVFVALKIPERLKNMEFSWTSSDVKMVYGGSILGGAIILTTLKFLGEKAPVIFEYIVHNKREKIIQYYSAVFVAALGFAIANLSLQEIVLPEPENTFSSPVFLNIKTPTANLATDQGSALPVFFITFPEASAAIKDNDSQLILLENLVQTLIECSKLGDENRQQLKLKIIGFASSSGTNMENKKLANQRAEWVKDYLQNGFQESLFEKEKITIIPHVWETFTEMRIRRVFVDENSVKEASVKYSEQAGALNRRAELHLLDVGGCQV